MPNVFEALFVDPFGSKSGPDIADFAFDRNAFSLKQIIVFETILAQIFPAYFSGLKTGALGCECILIDTESSFSIIAFVLFVDNYLSTHYKTTQSTVIDEVCATFAYFLDFESITCHKRTNRC